MKLRELFSFGRRKLPIEVEAERIYREKIGDKRVESGDGFDLVKFEGDYETYKEIQTAANKAKINWRSVHQPNIEWLCDRLAESGNKLNRILCHGTRNGAEQSYFRAKLPDAEIIGTEISDTATQFPMTIQWDFHEVKPEWLGAIDVVFSNSWDHSYQPQKLFPAWLSCVAPGGAMVLEWSERHAKNDATAIDPFRAELPALMKFVTGFAGNFLPPEVAWFGNKAYIITRAPKA